MEVEVARKDAVERGVLERQLERVALDEPRARNLLARDREHSLALVERDDVAAQVAREETRPAGDVERALRRQRPDQLRKHFDLVVPTRSLAVGEAAAAEPPVVVLERTPVVVRLHRFTQAPTCRRRIKVA